MGTHLYPSRDEWISGRDGDRCPEAAPGPTRHDAEIKPWSTRTNGDGMGVNKGATWAPAGGLREVVDLQRNTSVGKLVERIL